MKKYFYLIIICFCSCNTDNAPDCFKVAGTIVESEINVGPFSKISVNKKIQLFIKEGADYKVVIETGENIINEIDVLTTDGVLYLTNNIGCNFVRDYGITKAYVTAPNIEEIRNNSSLTVSSIGVLRYANLTLLSEDYETEEFYTNGDFILDLEVENLNITANGFSNFFLTGSAIKANIALYSGNSRVEAADFLNYNRQGHAYSEQVLGNPNFIRQFINGDNSFGVGNNTTNSPFTTQLLSPDNQYLLNQSGWSSIPDILDPSREILFYDNKNVSDRIYQDSASKDHYISFDGGNEKGTYYLGLGALDNDGLILINSLYLESYLYMSLFM